MKVNARKPHRPRVPDDVGESDAAGPALRRVHPISGPGICDRVSVATVPNVETVERMEGHRQPNPKELKEEDKRKIGEKTHLPGVRVRAADRGGVGNQNMFEKKSTDGNDA